MQNNLEQLILVARGQQKAALVFKNAQIFNSFTGEFESADLAISGGYIAGIGDYQGLVEYDASGCYLTPAFADAHVHIESSMLSPQEFAKVLLLNGTTSIFADPHEIVNVLGAAGMDYMLKATANLPVDVYFTLPACVPASPFETAAVSFDVREFTDYKGQPRVVGLGEMMNFPGVLNLEPAVIKRLKYFANKVIDGHAPTLTGKELNAYIAAGISSDHESFTIEEAEEKLRRGQYLYMREGSAAKNLSDLIKVTNEYNYRRICLATDDRHLDELLTEGGINYAVKLAMQYGSKLGHVLNMASLNTFERFGIREKGVLAPGYRADLLVFENLEDWKAHTVVKDGKIVVHNYQLQWPSANKTIPVPPDCRLKIPQVINLFIADKYGQGRANVIRPLAGQIFTQKWQTEVPVSDGGFVADSSRWIQKIAVLESHLGTGNIGLGLINLPGMTRGAIASTVAHDAHNLVVLGSNDADMLLAIAEIKRMGGGQVVVDNGNILGSLPLPVAGLMSKENYPTVAAQVEALDIAAYSLGIDRAFSPFMLLSFLCLSVIPALKLTDQGLVDSEKFEFIDVSAE